jgi:para-aminobenzoate synthetase
VTTALPRRLLRHVRRLPWAVDTEAAAAALLRPGRDGFWLDSSRPGGELGRWSYLGVDDGPLSHMVASPGPALDRLAAGVGAVQVGGERAPSPFAGGYVGYLGYEARAECGYPVRRRPRRADAPDAAWLFADRLVAVDHRRGETHLVALTPAGEPSPRHWFDGVTATLAAAAPRPEPVPLPLPDPADVAGALDRNRDGYVRDVERCLRHLRDGDSYEICLTASAQVPAVEPGLEVHRRLRRGNPAPFAAFLALAGAQIASASPERFLRVDPDGTVETRPIKGTAPRGRTPAEDAALRSTLAAGAKTRAENLVIVDLLRNDLHRVCEPGSVAVPRLMAVETYATVHQMVTTVTGRLRPGLGAVDALRACFPGGSMTGAPKHRTLEIIDAVERRARGVYSGTLGWIGLDGAADLAIVIRAAVTGGDTWEVGAGGGIVLDSDPVAEYEEMLLKATATLQALLPPAMSAGRPAPPVRASR